MSQLYYHTSGEGMPLVFQHGLAAESTQIVSLLDGIHSCTLISMDCRGHGKSLLSDPYNVSFERYADELLGLLEKLGLKEIILGGLSMGAGIALHIALRRPELIKGLILLRPAWLDQIDPNNLLILKKAATFIKTENGESAFEKNEEFQIIKKTLPDAANSILGIFGKHQQEGLYQVIDNMVSDKPFASLAQLSQINVPCLVVGNDEDPLHPFSIAEQIASHLPQAILKKLTPKYVNSTRHKWEVQAAINEFLININYNEEQVGG